MLKRRVGELERRLNATKKSMKAIHERLEANNHRKQQLIAALRRSRDLVLIDHCNTVHSLLPNTLLLLFRWSYR